MPLPGGNIGISVSILQYAQTKFEPIHFPEFPHTNTPLMVGVAGDVQFTEQTAPMAYACVKLVQLTIALLSGKMALKFPNRHEGGGGGGGGGAGTQEKAGPSQ